MNAKDTINYYQKTGNMITQNTGTGGITSTQGVDDKLLEISAAVEITEQGQRLLEQTNQQQAKTIKDLNKKLADLEDLVYGIIEDMADEEKTKKEEAEQQFESYNKPTIFNDTDEQIMWGRFDKLYGK